MKSPEAFLDQKARNDATLVTSLCELVREQFSFEVDSPETDLFETGLLDSMTLVQLIMSLEDRYGVRLPMQELGIESFRSLGAIADLLIERRPSAAAGGGL